MLDANVVPARRLQKSYKAIIEGVKAKKRPVVLTTKRGPQAALISLEDLGKLQQVKTTQNALEMLKLAVESRQELKDLPSNLREQANKILYSK